MSNKYKRILPQVLTLLFIVLIFAFFTINAQMNMSNRGIDFGYGFLGQESSFDVQFSLIEYDGSHSYARAYLVGLLNTILVSVLGIIFCTIIGVVVGIARLSPNYLIRTTAAWYVEFFRNVPLLLQIFFWYYAALRALPLPENTEPLFGATYLTVKGYYMPGFIWENFNILVYSILAAIISIIVIRLYAKKITRGKGTANSSFFNFFRIINNFTRTNINYWYCSTEVELPVLKQLSKTSFVYEGGVSVPPRINCTSFSFVFIYSNICCRMCKGWNSRY